MARTFGIEATEHVASDHKERDTVSGRHHKSTSLFIVAIAP